eukprot:COSAG06_NODE_2684_length_6454_cov_11.145712_4_plen_859_part_00
MEGAPNKRPRLSEPDDAGGAAPKLDEPAEADEPAAPDAEAAAAAAALAAAGDVRGLLLLEWRLHAVLAHPDAACAQVVGFLRRPSTCERLVRALLLFGDDEAAAQSGAADDVAEAAGDAGDGADTAGGAEPRGLGASERARAAFAASCVLGGGVPEVAATLATSSEVWRSLVSALQREQPSPAMRELSSSMLERMCRSFFLRAGSKAREGFVVMAKRHNLLQTVLHHRRGDAPQLLSLLPLIYRHDHSPKRYAYWSSLELGLQLSGCILAPLDEGGLQTDPMGLLEREHACDVLVSMCEWSAGDRRSVPGGGGGGGEAHGSSSGRSGRSRSRSSADARQWGLSLLAELTESYTYTIAAAAGKVATTEAAADEDSGGGEEPEQGHGQTMRRATTTTIAGALVELAVRDCSCSCQQQPRQQLVGVGVRVLSAVLSLSASLKQPTSSSSYAAITLLNALADAMPRIAAALSNSVHDHISDTTGAGAGGGGGAGGAGGGGVSAGSTALVETVRCIGAACDMVASSASASASASATGSGRNSHHVRFANEEPAAAAAAGTESSSSTADDESALTYYADSGAERKSEEEEEEEEESEEEASAAAIAPLRRALVSARIPTILFKMLLFGDVGRWNMAAAQIIVAVEHIWEAGGTLRGGLFAGDDDWWEQWCLPMLQRARLHVDDACAQKGSGAAEDKDTKVVVPTLGHIVALSCMCDSKGRDMSRAVSARLRLATDSSSSSSSSGGGGGGGDGRSEMWRKHMDEVVFTACREQSATAARVAQLKEQLKQQKQQKRKMRLQRQQQQPPPQSQDSSSGEGTVAGAVTGSTGAASVPVGSSSSSSGGGGRGRGSRQGRSYIDRMPRAD